MSTFAFKQFTVAQDRCAQKIGTDGVLLGAWATPRIVVPETILDIGTGTGIIALMLAQRFPAAQIDAVELSAQAHSQATENFENSPWADRLFCYHAAFQEYYEEIEDRYDLIVSNPPFFDSNNLQEKNTLSDERQQARFDDALPFEELLYGVYQLLETTGTFCCVIPAARETRFLEIAAHYKLYPSHITQLKGTASSAVKRSMLQLHFIFHQDRPAITPTTDLLIIEQKRHQYTNEYQELVKDFYLNM